MLNFKNNSKDLTLGVEMEIQLIDPKTLRPIPVAGDFIAALNNPKITKEMFRSTLEIVSGIADQVQDIASDLALSLAQIKEFAAENNILLASTGTHPTADYNNRILSPSDRYQQLMDKNQWIIKRMAVYGLHVHIGMLNADECIRFNNYLIQFLPHLIALSASSPFWKGNDTGLNASRPTTYEAHPTAGMPILVKDWPQFLILYDQLLQTHSIQSMKDVWWDLRPSPGYGTLEIRICDAPATMLEVESITAFIHLLAYRCKMVNQIDKDSTHSLPTSWILRENKWRAIRFGVEAEIIKESTLEMISIKNDIHQIISEMAPFIRELRYQHYMQCLNDILEKGNSAIRQRKVMENSGNINDVILHNIKEFDLGSPIW
ncbi:MAG: YbdK family carboxylate-amine ligase [Saprospiraceae bacterium]|nr:YbdK family carboxylate-amine ligase [Saprospiraceae bacterium]